MQDSNLLALSKGAELNHYIIDDVLGQGGFGIVYKAHHKHLNELVVIKEFLPVELAGRSGDSVAPHSTDKSDVYDDCLRRFMVEGQTLVKLKHENLVRCRDLFKANGTAYLVMDFEDGCSLDDLIKGMEQRGERYSEEQLLHFLIPLAEGLSYVHQEGVLHRDIKPANVFIRRSNSSPVILDFGAAKQNFAQASQSRAPFTEFYAPIEQIEGDVSEKAKATIDIHAFGGLMYRAATGILGPKAERRVGAIARGKEDPLEPAKVLAKEFYSQAFLSIIDDCLEFNEENRPQSMELVIPRLKALASGASESVSKEQDNFHLLDELIQLAGADLVISENEMTHLLSKAEQFGIDKEQARQSIISKAVANGWSLGEEKQDTKNQTPNKPEQAEPKEATPAKKATSAASSKESPSKDKIKQSEPEKPPKKTRWGAGIVFVIFIIGILYFYTAYLEYTDKALQTSIEQEKALKIKKNEDSEWKNAVTNDSQESYEKYLKAYPNGRYVYEAKRGLAKYNTYALLINTTPADAIVRILNITPKYSYAMKLKPGPYHIEVSKSGYATQKQWIELGKSDKTQWINLEEKDANCISGNCTDGFGTFVWASDSEWAGDKYMGDWVNGFQTGNGTYTWSNGNEYTGEFVNNKRTGKGTFTWPNGDTYIGDFVNGSRQGKGKYIFASKNTYEGDWLNGERTGKGVFTWPDGNKYTGDFIAGERSGKGTFIWPDGEKYIGDYVKGARHGKGKYIFANKNIYDGDWLNGERTGTGTFTWTDGSKYTGDFIDGERTGKGIYLWPDGTNYSGDFVNGNFNGQGVYSYPSGAKTEGGYKDDKKHGNHIYTDKNGNREARYYQNGKQQ